MTFEAAIADWSASRQRAAKRFVADVTRKAVMMKDPEAVDVQVKVEGRGLISVRAESRLYDAFGCCVIGPKGGINHRHDMLHYKF